MLTYLVAITGAILAAIISTPLVARLARLINAVDNPGLRKVHQQAIPRIGGIAIVVGMLTGLGAAFLLGGPALGELWQVASKIVVLIVMSLSIFLIGFLDDLIDLPAKARFLAQIIAAVVLCRFGICIERIHLLSSMTVELGWMGTPLTVLWIVGVTNAVNLIDGLDGLAAGISAVACAVIALLAVYSGQTVMAVLMFSLLGGLLGFLVFNFNPAKIFMGDCGSTFLGFFLAGASVLCATKVETFVGLALPALALGVPIFDTLFSMLRRFLERRGVMSPDRSHLHHKLLDMGLRQKHVVLFLYTLTLVAAGLGMFMMVTRDASTLVIFACIIGLIVGVFRWAGIISFRRTISALRRNHQIATQTRHDRAGFNKAVLRLRQADTFDQWWKAVCAAAEVLDITSLRMTLPGRDGSDHTLMWEHPGHAGNIGEVVRSSVPVRQRRVGPPAMIDLDVPVNGSLECATNRLGLFGRLVEENSLAMLMRAHAETRVRKHLFANLTAFRNGDVSRDVLRESLREETSIMDSK